MKLIRANSCKLLSPKIEGMKLKIKLINKKTLNITAKQLIKPLK